MSTGRNTLLLLALLTALGSSHLRAQESLQGTVAWRGRLAAGAVIELIPVNANEGSSSDTLLIDQRNLRFVPRTLAVQRGTTIEFHNSDQIMHNVFSPERRGADFDLGTYPEGESRTHTFVAEGSFVILCHVHPEMAAWVVVSASPWVAASDEQGRFEIANVPPGEYELVGWYRRRVVHRATTRIEQGQTMLTVEMGK